MPPRYASQLGKLKPKWIPISQFRAADSNRAAALRSAASSPLTAKAALVGETNPGSPLVHAVVPPAESTRSISKPAEKVDAKRSEPSTGSAAPAPKTTAAVDVVEAKAKEPRPEKTIPSGPKALANPPLRNGASRTAEPATNGSAAVTKADAATTKADTKTESAADSKDDSQAATRYVSRSSLAMTR